MRLRSLGLLTALLILAPALATVATPGVAAAVPAPPVVTILGDSITAGLGLPQADALPAQLQHALSALGVAATVRGAGVSGDTTAGGLARIDFSVQPDTRVCVVELGGNDYLQSVSPAVVKTNLTAIVRRLKARHIGVILTGSTPPRASSGAYGRSFGAVFTDVARTAHVALVGDLLAGNDGRSALKQADGLHPNAAGVKTIVARLAPVVRRALARP